MGAFDVGSASAYGEADHTGVTNAVVELLRQTRPWVLFLSIVAFIASALLLLAGGGMFLTGLLGPDETRRMVAVGLVYIPMALLYVYPAIKLWTYGSAISRLVSSHTAADLEIALTQQKRFWKFSGIATIAVIGLYVVLFVGALIAGFAASHGAH